jgi:hypothetical protein
VYRGTPPGRGRPGSLGRNRRRAERPRLSPLRNQRERRPALRPPRSPSRCPASRSPWSSALVHGQRDEQRPLLQGQRTWFCGGWHKIEVKVTATGKSDNNRQRQVTFHDWANRPIGAAGVVACASQPGPQLDLSSGGAVQARRERYGAPWANGPGFVAEAVARPGRAAQSPVDRPQIGIEATWVIHPRKNGRCPTANRGAWCGS